MLRGVLGFARRDQGEIPFALDRTGCALHARSVRQGLGCEALGVERTAIGRCRRAPLAAAATGSSSRARHQAASFSASRDRSATRCAKSAARRFATWASDLLVIALAFVGIIPDFASDDAAPRRASRTACASSRGGNFGARVPGSIEGRVRRAGRRVQPDGRGPRTSRGAGRRAGAAAPRAGTVAADSDRDAAARIAAIGRRPRSAACRFRRAKSAATSSTTSCCPTAAWRCSSATSRGKASARRCLMANIQATLRARLPHETDLAGAGRPARPRTRPEHARRRLPDALSRDPRN